MAVNRQHLNRSLGRVESSVVGDTLPEKVTLSEEPRVDPTAMIRDSRLGAWTEVGPGWSLLGVVLGDYSYAAGSDGVIHNTEIGNFCSLASHVVVNPGDHPMQRVTQHHLTYRKSRYELGPDDDTVFDWRRSRACRIGHDVWIGHGAMVMAGVAVGTGAVVGAGSVVTRDVAPYQVVVGAPARPVRSRFPEAVVEKLLGSRWWEWHHELLSQRMDDLTDLSRFLEKYC
jgi:phosphonate metabolism protein (transferase hexapeptide repeat family)